MSVAMEWDMICVGAGITSLAFAAQLVKRNPSLQILVVDKHLVPGGYASMFKRPLQEATFDCSLHKLTGMTGAGNLKRMFDDLALTPDLEFVFPAYYFEASFEQEKIRLPNNPAQLKSELSARYPDDHAGIEQFFSEVELYGKNSYYQFQIMQGVYERPITDLISELRFAHKNLRNITVDQRLRQLMQSPQLRELLSLPVGYVGCVPEEIAYLYYLHLIYATLYVGNAYVKGGSQRLSDLLVERIESNGSKVMLRTRAEKVLVNSQKNSYGVATNRGDFFSKEVFINAAPQYAIDNLFDPSEEINAVRDKLMLLKPSWSLLTLYVVVDEIPAELGLSSTETFLVGKLNEEASEERRQAEAAFDSALCEEAYWKSSRIEITNYHALDPAGGSILIFNLLDKIDHWPERRTREYKEKKQRATQVVLERFFERFPQFRGHIQYSEISSPRTYLRYTNNTAGAGFGALIGIDLNPHLFHHRFPIGNVQFMSSWLAGSGFEAAFGFAEQKALTWKPPATSLKQAA